LPTLNLCGTVFSGKGEGKKFVSLSWVKRQVEEKADFTPFEGTLNLRLTRENIEKRDSLEKAQRLKIEPAQGYCPGFLVKAKVGEVPAAIILPMVPNYPADVLEVVAPVCLRKTLGLNDGCLVAITLLV
jgi:riboflavin kinase, archaea type